jgi:hypothetical protein
MVLKWHGEDVVKSLVAQAAKTRLTNVHRKLIVCHRVTIPAVIEIAGGGLV